MRHLSCVRSEAAASYALPKGQPCDDDDDGDDDDDDDDNDDDDEYYYYCSKDYL